MRIVSLMVLLSVLLAVPASAFIVRSVDPGRTWNVQSLVTDMNPITGQVVGMPTARAPAARCYNGARICEGSVLYACKDHEWKVAERCAASQVCVSPRGCVTPQTELRKTTRQPVTPLSDCARWKPYASAPKGCAQDLSNQVRWTH